MRTTLELYPEFGCFEIWTATHISICAFFPAIAWLNTVSSIWEETHQCSRGKYIYISVLWNVRNRESGLVYIFFTIIVSETASELAEKCQHSPEHVSGHHLGMFEGIFIFYDFHFSATVAVLIIFTSSSSFVVPLCFFCFFDVRVRVVHFKKIKLYVAFFFFKDFKLALCGLRFTWA